MGNDITHKGVVKSISGDKIRVEILSSSACAQCHAKMMCGVSDRKVKVIDIADSRGDEFSVGEEVNVHLRREMGMKAVLISYVVPVIILLVLLLSLSAVLENELFVGLFCLGALAVYYTVIFLCRGKIEKKFTFTIEKI